MAVGQGNRVVLIAGLGARSAVGASAAASAAAIRARVSMFSNHPFMISKFGTPMIVARDAFLPEDELGAARFAGLAVPAAREAATALFNAPERHAGDVDLLIGLPPGRPGLPPGLAEILIPRLWEASGRS